ncbi:MULTISPECIES: hypothetical protein [unclassified Streptomyces]|uniref:HAAS signaling domain-containing protein n=1 Tax=unclassified Streptomyces TaxID=2593676 RepID=UPI0006FD38AF|nr:MULTISPECIES: hypothetical protein [unclassified Streptomyces]KQX46151.1 hypothetical protein ASD33_22685 [Streptomyces sp. Root1304]KRA80936.1 hypothetical protein ASE09_15785 [Streptomyces sp. Root66D1]
MNAIDHPLVAAYLDAVARETVMLPAERRAELLADLREHVEAAGARDDDQVRAVLAGLGDPRTVAASALTEEAPAGTVAPAADFRGRTRLTALLLSVSGLLLLIGSTLGTIALIASMVLLWTSSQWDRREKVIATAACVTVPVLVFLGALLGAAGRIGPTELLLVAVFSLGVPVAGATMLVRAARR